MAESVDIKVQESGGKVKVFGENSAEVAHLMKQATDDVADKIESYAKAFAPLGESGALKSHPTDRKEIQGEVETRAFQFGGGGFSVRGAGGQFVSGSGSSAGKVVSHIIIELPEDPPEAIWVHEGTGIFGPRKSAIVSPNGNFMVFRGRTGIVKTLSVKGQHPQPYLTEAFEFVDRTYVPKRVEQLKEEIRLFLS